MIAHYDTTGRHIVADVYGAKSALALSDLLFAARIANMSVCSAIEEGGSLAIVLAESHLTAHRRGADVWHIDCYTCGGDNDTWLAVEYLVARLDAEIVYVYEWERGNRDDEESPLAQIDDEAASTTT